MDAGNNILLDPLPRTVTVEGREIPIRTDYRTGIRFELLARDRKIGDRDRVIRGLLIYYDEHDLPQTSDGLIAANNAALWFYRMGEAPEKQPTADEDAKKRAKAKRPVKRLVDYVGDAQCIYAAFLDQYRIDLQETPDLHWWKFRALFAGLREDHLMMKIIGYRAAEPARITNKTERMRIQRLQALYSIPDDLTPEERVDRAGSIFGGV